MNMKEKIIIAIPKGRILKELEPILKKIKVLPEQAFYKNDNRKMMFSTS